MDRVSSRHEGDLAGRLAPFAASRPVVVVVSIPRDVAGETACQHTAWMLVNLLARAEGIVERVIISCPSGIRLAGRVVPLAGRSLRLADALLAGTAAIDTVPVEFASSSPASAMRFVVWPGDPPRDAVRVHGERWWGGISTSEIPGACDSGLPLGPYAAACFAAGEVFKTVRLRGYAPLEAAFYSLASFQAFAYPPRDPRDTGTRALDGVSIGATVAGVGAVGSTWVHAMWATPGIHGAALLADADELGVDATNLNRCPIFGRSSIGKRKATEAARICHDGPLSWDPHDGPIGSTSARPPTLLSAVDTNASRQAVQGLYPPRLISASTLDLRAELLRCDPRAQTACIHCYNPVQNGLPDDELRRRFLAMAPEEQGRLAEELRVSMEDAQRWARDGMCGYVGDRLAARLRPSSAGPAAFAVGFVSIMAGTMLAAQTIHEAVGRRPLDGLIARAVMTFLDPTAPTNRPARFGRQPDCPMCDPETPATDIWRRRYDAYPG